jgi:hypothetical protein
MATISVNTFLDQAVRTAGEAWTMNGAILTIRTDTRWHAGKPTGMTGSIGATTINAAQGGGVLIDATKVRWMPFNGGGGNVPAIGATITQGEGENLITGILLGVWTDLASAPLTPGTAMPASGFLKFREVVDGPFAIGALTGITASATAPDRTGWIEVVQEQAVANTVPRLGFFRTRGDWFYLDDTTGVAGQIIQIPNNGGGTGAHVPAIWIETSPGSGQYEIFTSLLSAHFITTNLSIDARSKFVESLGSGQVRIGNNGTVNVGYLPPAGCKVRIPNIIGRQTTSANRALNLVPHGTLATRPDWTTTSAGFIDLEFFITDWYHLFTAPFKVIHKNCATFDILSTSNNAAPIEVDNLGVGAYNGTSIPLVLLSNPLGGVIKNSKFFRREAASNGHVCTITTSNDYTFENCHFGVVTYARSTGRAIATSQSLNLKFLDIYQYNSYTQHTTSFDILHQDLDHCDRFVGDTNGTTGMYCIAILTSSNNIKVDRLTFGLKGLITDFCNSFLSPFYSINSSNITFRNAGTRANPLRVASAALGPQYAVHDAGVNTNLIAQRIYLEFTRTSVLLTVNTSKNLKLESVHGTVGAIQTLSLNTLLKGIRAASNSVTGGASVYGSHFFDMFESDTVGRLWLALNEPTAFSEHLASLSIQNNGGFTSGGQIAMPTVDDYFIIEMPYFAIGHTGFANTAPTLTGTNTGNHSYEYDIDLGSGFSGTYKTLNGANLSEETVNPATGFKLRLRITTTVEAATNALTYVRLDTTTSFAAQTNNLYPLDYAKIKLTGYILGTRIQIYDTTNNVELYNGIPATTTLDLESPYVADANLRIRAMYVNGATAKKFVEFTDTLTVSGVNRSIVQEDETVYILNGINGSTVTTVEIEDANLLVKVDTGIINWADIYAYETYWLGTEEGIRDEGRFIEAIDPANYKLFNFKVKNVSSPTAPLLLTGGWAVDGITGKSIDIIDTTGGTIFSAPDHVVAFETSGGGSGGGATPAEIWGYAQRRLTSAGINDIKEGLATEEELEKVKKNANLIPALL